MLSPSEYTIDDLMVALAQIIEVQEAAKKQKATLDLIADELVDLRNELVGAKSRLSALEIKIL